MLTNNLLAFFAVFGMIIALGVIFVAWRQLNKKPVEAQDWKRNRAETLWKDAVDLQSKGSFAKALEKWKQSAFMESDSSSPRPSFLGQVHNELGYCCYRSGLFKESEENFKKSLTFFRKNSLRTTFDTAFTLNNYALLCMETGRHDLALTMIRRSMKIFSSGLGDQAPQLVHVLNNLARSHIQIGAYASARAVLEKALEIVSHSLLAHYPESLLAKELMAETFKQLGNLNEAERLFLEVINTKEAIHGQKHPGILPALHSLGQFYLHQNFADKSLAIYQRILAIVSGHYGPEHHFVAEFLNQFACLKIQTNEFQEARLLLEKSLAILTLANKMVHPAMLINLYLRFWLANREWEAEQVPVFFKQALVLLQIPELSAMENHFFHLATLAYDRLKAPLSAIYFGKKAVSAFLTKNTAASHGNLLPGWLVPPSDKRIGEDLGEILRRQQRISEVQTLELLFTSDSPAASSLKEKFSEHQMAGWPLSEMELGWEKTMGEWQHHVANVLFPKVSENNAGKEKDSVDKKPAQPSKPAQPPKPEEIMKKADMMDPIMEELEQIFATMNV
ncbi:MAG: TPR REGION protein [Magnetococcales bacterium]|nr:TPR REGION protein [Magnetococcales bacterium]HIJ84144.1 tetratricopeptide repeat protein [Magnetococcales bacterium]